MGLGRHGVEHRGRPEAAVAPQDVFALYADPTTWSTWGHNARWASADGPLEEGGTVEVQPNYRATYHCRIRRRFATVRSSREVRPLGLLIVNVYEVEPTELGSRVRHPPEFSGRLAGPVRWIGLGRLYRGRLLEREVRAVIELAAARRTGAEQPDRLGSGRRNPSPARDTLAPSLARRAVPRAYGAWSASSERPAS